MAESYKLPEDADLQVIVALFRAKLPARGRKRLEMLSLRDQYRNILEVMVELKRLGLIDLKR